MSEQQPLVPRVQVSADGKWRWDGTNWVPNTPAAYMVPAQSGGMVVAPKNPAVSLLSLIHI